MVQFGFGLLGYYQIRIENKVGKKLHQFAPSS